VKSAPAAPVLPISTPHQLRSKQGRGRRTICRERIRSGLVAVEPIPSLLVAPELSTQVVGRLVVRVLEVVLAVCTRLPDIDDSAGDGLLGVEISDGAVHEGGLAVGSRVLDDGGAVLPEGRVGRPEGSEDAGGGGLFAGLVDVLVGDFIDQPVTSC
jgi:hypothetical protein